MDYSERLFRINQRTPHQCPISYERIRKEALHRWGKDTAISYSALMAWLEKGAPDSEGALLRACTHQPPFPGQAKTSPCEELERLIDASIFLDADTDGS